MDNTNEKVLKNEVKWQDWKWYSDWLELGIPKLHLLSNTKSYFDDYYANLSLSKINIQNIFYCFYHNRIKQYWWGFYFFFGGGGRGWGVVVVMGSVGKGYFRPIPVRGIMIQLSMCSQPQLWTSGSKCYELTVTFNIQPKKGSVEYWWIVLKYFQKFSVWFCFSKNNTYENFGFSIVSLW